MIEVIGLGLASQAKSLLPMLLNSGLARVRDYAQEFISAPNKLGRIGDLIVWHGPDGQHVIAGLDSLAESQSRIEGAVSHIEAAQTTMNGALGVIQSVSLATLGVTALSAGFMAFRLHALENRLQRLSNKIDDVDGKLDAQHKAHLSTAMTCLNAFEKGQRSGDLEKAFYESCEATGIYGELAINEAEGQKRIPVLNYRSRCYLLSLMTQLQCMVLRDDLLLALDQAAAEQPRLQLVARTTFDETVGKGPEVYLDPNLQADGVTLEMLTEVYQQAHSAGAIGDVQVADANQMFEYLRERIFRYRRNWLWKPVGKAKEKCLKELRYLLACVEDTNRIEAIRLLIREVVDKKIALTDLVAKLREFRKADHTLVAYTLA